jgi:DNA-binding NarL/FixJ family response regulator
MVRRSLRSCIQRIPDWQVCGEAENGLAAVEMVKRLGPDLVILDLSMPVMNGLDAAKQISAMSPALPMILFTMLDCDELLRASARAVGIKHVFSKSDGFGEHVLRAMRELMV